MEQRDRVCDICGNIGYAEDIVRCCRCGNAYEHIYCMQNQTLVVPRIWNCGVCQALGQAVEDRKVQCTSKEEESVGCKGTELQTTKSPEKINLPLNDRKRLGRSGKHAMRLSSSTSIRTKKHNPPRTAYLPVNEAVMMTPGSSKFRTPKKIDTTPRQSFQRSVAPQSVSLTVTQCTPLPVVPVTRVPPALCVKDPTAGSGAEVMGNITSGKSSAPDKVARVLNNGTAQMKSFRGLSGTVSLSGSQHKLTALDEECVRRPDPEVCWKGSFDVFELLTHHFGEIEAHLPYGQVPVKVYEASQQMPKNLKFKLLPRTSVWPRLFQKDPPSSDDVGLYFLPSEAERQREKYFRLFDRLDSRDCALKSCLGDVELLVFASNQLLDNSGKCAYLTGIAGRKYLWGLFRHVKCKVIQQKQEQSSSPLPAVGSERSSAPLEGRSEEVDMEVDMVGGHEFGRIDRPIPRVNAPEANSKLVSSGAHFGSRPSGKFFLTKKAPGFSRSPVLKNGGNSSYATHNCPVSARGERKSRDSLPARDDQTTTKSEVCKGPKSPEVSTHGVKSHVHCSGSYHTPNLQKKGCDSWSKYNNADKRDGYRTARKLNSPDNLSCLLAKEKASKSRENPVRPGSKIYVEAGISSPSSRSIENRNCNSVEKSNEKNSQNPLRREHSSLEATLPLFTQGAESAGSESEFGRMREDLRRKPRQSSPDVSPNLSLSRPNYVRDGDTWISAFSTEHLKEDGGVEDLSLAL